MNVTVLLGYGMSVAIAWWWLVSDILPTLRRSSAPPWVESVEASAFAAFSVVAAAAVIGWLPFFSATIALVIPLLAGFGTPTLIRLAGGSVDKESFRRAYYGVWTRLGVRT